MSDFIKPGINYRNQKFQETTIRNNILISFFILILNLSC